MTRSAQQFGKAAPLVAFLAFSNPSFAADSQGRYAVEGPGSQRCSAFLELEPASRDYAVTAGYVSGFLNAANAFQSETYDLTPWQSLELSILQLRQFCESNPDDSLGAGLIQYTAFLAPNRLAEEEERVSLQVGDQVVVQYRAVVDRIRAALKERGFGTENEPLSGLKEFQHSVGLEDTGLPDQMTLTRLFGTSR